MNVIRSPRILFLAALGVVVVTNIFVLAQMGINKRAEPTSKITLSERELSYPRWRPRENSGLALQLEWNVPGSNQLGLEYYFAGGEPSWLDAPKLKSLGFDVERSIGKNYKRAISKEVYVVLEFDGPAYHAALSQLEQAYEEARQGYQASGQAERLKPVVQNSERRYTRLRDHASRLFAVDAGLDPAVLRRLYPQMQRFLIVKGIVNVSRNYVNSREKVRGYISRLSVDRLHAPISQRRILDGLAAEATGTQQARYNVDLVYGSLYIPWIEKVTRRDAVSKPQR